MTIKEQVYRLNIQRQLIDLMIKEWQKECNHPRTLSVLGPEDEVLLISCEDCGLTSEPKYGK